MMCKTLMEVLAEELAEVVHSSHADEIMAFGNNRCKNRCRWPKCSSHPITRSKNICCSCPGCSALSFLGLWVLLPPSSSFFHKSSFHLLVYHVDRHLLGEEEEKRGAPAPNPALTEKRCEDFLSPLAPTWSVCSDLSVTLLTSTNLPPLISVPPASIMPPPTSCSNAVSL